MSRSNYNRPKPSPLPLRMLLIIGSGIVLVGAVFGARMLITKMSSRIPAVYPDVAARAFLSHRTLVYKVTMLEATVDSYRAQLTELALLRDENEKLKAEFGRGVQTPGVLAHVLTLPNRSFYNTFIIDAGSAEGITEGQSVFAFENIAVGTIAQVDEHSATVSLYSAPGRETAGTAQGSDVAVMLTGRGNGEYEVRMPRDVHFDIGSMIAYQSVHTAVIAQIEKIVGDPRDPFQRLLAKAPVNLQALKWVIVQ